MALVRAGASPRDAINLDDYDDPVISAEDREVVTLESRIHNYRPQKGRPSVVAAYEIVDEEEEENIAGRELAEVIDLTADDEPIFIRRLRKRPRRPQPVIPERQHDKIQRNNNFCIKVGTLYELDPEQAPRSAVDIDFILVTEIFENLATFQLRIRGMPFCRSRLLMAKLPRKLNEVFAIYELDEEDGRSPESQAKIEVSDAALMRPRTLHTTNAPYPQHRYDPRAFRDRGAVVREGPLVYRWKFVVRYQNLKAKSLHKAHHWTLERVRADEVSRNEFRVQEEYLRTNWRGETIPGGSHRPVQQASASATDESSIRQQRYTVFDSFSGAGGFTRGAERAGLRVKYAVDHWDKACDSYRLNFPDVRLFQMSVDEFLLSYKDVQMYTDILHLSPPCQTWSPAHTIPGVNDEANIAALFACRSLVEKIRPRIFTLEQTFGILQARYDPFFCSLVGGFTELGYSVTWKIVHLQTWGLPQTRKRLIMIGACPGEKLPPFPEATHSETGAGVRSKYVTIRQALSRISGTSNNHEPELEMRDILPLESVISDPDQILRRCVTCSGGQNMHWSNTRAYTPRELASLQGFPVWHRFAPTSKANLKKQIGNAFPACVVRLLYEHLKRWLLETDGLAAVRRYARGSVFGGGRDLLFVSENWRREIPPPVFLSVESGGRSFSDVIMLDDDDDDDNDHDEDDNVVVQCDIKYDDSSDTEMGDILDVPDSPRSATLSLGGTPEPVQFGGFRDSPIHID